MILYLAIILSELIFFFIIPIGVFIKYRARFKAYRAVVLVPFIYISLFFVVSHRGGEIELENNQTRYFTVGWTRRIWTAFHPIEEFISGRAIEWRSRE